MQQEQAAKQLEHATPQQGHDRINQSLQQSNVTELATTASPGPSGLLCLNNTMRSTRESVDSKDLRATAVDHLQPALHSVSFNGDLLTTPGSKLKSESSMLVNQIQSNQDSKTHGRHQPFHSEVCMSPRPPSSMAAGPGARTQSETERILRVCENACPIRQSGGSHGASWVVSRPRASVSFQHNRAGLTSARHALSYQQ
jgi:hypothetical protein